MHLGRIYILLLLNGVFYRCQVRFIDSVVFYILADFLSSLCIIESGGFEIANYYFCFSFQ